MGGEGAWAPKPKPSYVPDEQTVLLLATVTSKSSLPLDRSKLAAHLSSVFLFVFAFYLLMLPFWRTKMYIKATKSRREG